MADKSKIEWTDSTWNPVRARNIHTGKLGWHCEHVTEACRFCYAERQNDRQGDSGGTGFPYKPGHLGKDVEVFLDAKKVIEPLRWTKGRKIFPCSMSDLFADFVRDEWLEEISLTMRLSIRHTYQILTKRPRRMAKFTGHMKGGEPMPHIWLGTSVCDQADANEAIPYLLSVPAAVHWISAEPLLGPIDLSPWIDRLGWVVTGGESGFNDVPIRPSHPDWFRGLRDQCAVHGVPFNFKQWGNWHWDGQAWADGMYGMAAGDVLSVTRVPTARAGRLLDGVEHNGFPA